MFVFVGMLLFYYYYCSINPIYADLKCTVKIDELLLVYCGGMEDLLRILSLIVGFFFFLENVIEVVVLLF